MIVEDISSVRPGINNLLIKLPKLNDEIAIAGGKSLFIDISYETNEHVNVHGEVIALPTRILFNKRNPSISLDHCPKQVLQVGDMVYFDYFHALQAMGDLIDRENAPESKYLKYKGDTYIMLVYSAVYFAKRGDEIIPANGYTICEELHESSTIKTKLIEIPDHLKKKKSSKYARVLFPGAPNRRYLNEKYADPTGLKSGDIIVFTANANRKVENKLHQSFKKGMQILAIQGRWIIAKLDNTKEIITLDEHTELRI